MATRSDANGPASDCLAGGGAMGALMRAFNWAGSPLGPIDAWPHSLRTVTRTMLASAFPMLVLWGDEHVQLYNDAFRPVLGTTKHPAALGQPARYCWREIWDDLLGPMVGSVVATQKPVWNEDRLLVLDRNGRLEETFLTFSLSAIGDDGEYPRGVLCTCVETTDRVVGERRLRLLRELAVPVSSAQTVDDTCRMIARTLAADQHDVPFALVYLSEDGAHARLRATVHLEAGSTLAPSAVNLSDQASSPWPIAHVIATADVHLVSGLQSHEGMPATGPWPEPPNAALVLPIVSPEEQAPFGALVAGVSPRRALDAGYRGFLETAAAQIGAAVSHAEAYARERHFRLAHEECAEHGGDAYEEYLAEIFTQFPSPAAVVRGPDFIVELANPAIREAAGRAHEEVIGRAAFDLLPELKDQRFPGMLRQVMTTGRPRVGEEVEIRLRRGPGGTMETAYFNFVFAPLRDARGRTSRVLVIAIEVTDQVLARRQVDELRQQAETANRAKDEFLAVLGHELRNPLAPILTALQLMHLRGGEVLQKERMIIERQARHLVRLVDDLLDVSRIARRVIYLRKERIELSEVVARAIETVSPLFERREHELSVDVPSHGLEIDADPARLGQVVMNLLANAAKYTDERGRIIIRGWHEAGQVCLSVKDTGTGIEPEMLPKVFDMFTQEKQAIDRTHGGLGLGLTIVRSLVQLHGGSVAAYSEGRGRGAEFVVCLPAAAHDTQAPAVPTEHAAVSRPNHARRILIVDDNQDMALTLAELLEAKGHIVRVAHDGPSALRTTGDFVPDVALIDIGLPVMDGYELAQRLRERGELRHAKLVAITGYGQAEDQQRAAAAGFDLHMVKPLDLDQLQSLIAPGADRSTGE